MEHDEIDMQDSSASEQGASDLIEASAAGVSLSSKELERARLQEQINAFLASGGQISHVPSNLLADPPKKPESNYGGQPI